jgi:hypothetical protein
MAIRAAIAHLLLQTLEPEERAVVEGDLAELNVPQSRAIAELLGLVARRQVAAWLEWRPWAALLMALPLGMMLSLISRYWARGTAIYAWLYLENWTPAYLASPGARGDLLHAITALALECLALVGWAWTIGLAVGSVSRRTLYVTSAAFAAIVFVGTVGSTTISVRNPANAVVFSRALYREGLPLAFRVALVLIPAFHGMSRPSRQPALTLTRAAILATSVALVTITVARGPVGAVTFGWWSVSGDGPTVSALSRLRESWQLWLLPMAMTLPASYLFVSAAWRTWQPADRQAL